MSCIVAPVRAEFPPLIEEALSRKHMKSSRDGRSSPPNTEIELVDSLSNQQSNDASSVVTNPLRQTQRDPASVLQQSVIQATMPSTPPDIEKVPAVSWK